MTTSNIPGPATPPAVKKESLEIRLNSTDDARAAVQNFIALQKEAKKRGMDRITFLVERTLSKDIHAIIGSFFRQVKTSYAWVEATPDREFFPLPHYRPPSVASGAKASSLTETQTSVPLHLPSEETPAPPTSRRRPGRRKQEASEAIAGADAGTASP